MTQTLTLIFMSGSRDGEEVQFDAVGSPPSVSIGREVPCELVITDDPDLSRRHARIVWNGSSWTLEDLNSSNERSSASFKPPADFQELAR
jgi:pSer/pThr/pTyr-binding forkhead associated (FHA) protein